MNKLRPKTCFSITNWFNQNHLLTILAEGWKSSVLNPPSTASVSHTFCINLVALVVWRGAKGIEGGVLQPVHPEDSKTASVQPFDITDVVVLLGHILGRFHWQVEVFAPIFSLKIPHKQSHRWVLSPGPWISKRFASRRSLRYWSPR